MKAFKRSLVAAAAMVSVGAMGPATARAQDPVKVAPDNYKVLFENGHIRVCDVTAKPGGKIAMHSHPDHIVYIVSGGDMKLSYPEGKGKPKELKHKPGEALWIAAETHEGENSGKEDMHAVVFELKGHAVASDAEKKIKEVPGHAKVLLENDRVRVIETVLKPGEKSAMHSHPAYVVYAVKGGKFKATDAEGKTTEKELADGQTSWSEPLSHAVENVGTTEARVVNVEIKGLTLTKTEEKPKEKPKP